MVIETSGKYDKVVKFIFMEEPSIIFFVTFVKPLVSICREHCLALCVISINSSQSDYLPLNVLPKALGRESCYVQQTLNPLSRALISNYGTKFLSFS